MPVAAAEDETAVAMTEDSTPVIVAVSAEVVAPDELVTARTGPDALRLCPG